MDDEAGDEIDQVFAGEILPQSMAFIFRDQPFHNLTNYIFLELAEIVLRKAI